MSPWKHQKMCRIIGRITSCLRECGDFAKENAKEVDIDINMQITLLLRKRRLCSGRICSPGRSDQALW